MNSRGHNESKYESLQSPGTHQVMTSPNRMQSEAVAAVLLATPHSWRTNEKLMREAMAVQVV